MRLTRQEMILIGALCLALVTGAVVKHHRDSARGRGIGDPQSGEDKPGIVSVDKRP